MTALMMALRVHEWQGLPRLEYVPVPAPEVGESLVRIEAAGVTHLDLTVLSGDFDIRPRLPYIGGVEGAGTVVASARFAKGTKVAVRNSGLGMERDGTWAEYVAVPDDELVEVPPDMPIELAGSYFDPLATAYVALHDVAQLGSWIAEGDTGTCIADTDEIVAVTGAAGAVGSAAVQLALRSDVRVIGLVSRPESVPFVPDGAETVVLSDSLATATLAKDRSITMLIDTTGGAELTRRLGWIRPGCRAAIVGYTAGTDTKLDLPNWLLSDVALLPVNMIRRAHRAGRLDDQLSKLVISGAVKLSTEILPMAQAEAAISRLRSGNVRGRLIIKP